MEIDFSKSKFYYKDSLIAMDSFSRFLARGIILISYIALSIVTILFIFGSSNRLRYLGLLLLIFLIDRLVRKNKSWKSFDSSFRQKAIKGDNFNLVDFATPLFKSILVEAADKTFSLGGSLNLRILDKLLTSPDFRRVFSKMDITPNEFHFSLQEELKKSIENEKKYSKKEILILAEEVVFKSMTFLSNTQLEVKDMFSSCFFRDDVYVKNLMNQFKFVPEDVRAAIVFGEFRKRFLGLKSMPMTLSSFAKYRPQAGHRVMNRAWTARPTPYLDSISIDLTDLARGEEIGFMIGHEKERTQIANILSRPDKNNAMLIGDSGSGKETIVMHLGYKIATDNVPPELFDKRLIMLSVSQLAAGGTPEEVLERTRRVIDEILVAKNVILYIPDFDNLTKTSGNQYLSAADAILPNLSRGDFQIIASVTPQDFKKEIEPRSDLTATFEAIKVEEISEDEAIQLLSYSSLVLENQYRVNISFRAIKRAVKVSKRYFREKLLPSSAEELLKESLAYIRNLGDNDLNEEDVVAVAQSKMNIPLSEADDKEADKLLNLEAIIHKRLIGQEEAVKAVSRALREYRAGLSRKGGPIATFLFAGPTGVGKTELSKILASIQFGSENNMARFDMSEYQDKQSIFRFIGSPDGQVSGALTESVRKTPYSLILLDEFEKAHPDILNMFLGVFDDGRLTDNMGRTVDFTNTIIIATSNAHSELIKTRLEEDVAVDKISEELKKRLTDYFRPELINRFSAVIAFRPLTIPEVRKITVLMLKGLSKTLEQDQNIVLQFGESAVDRLLEIGYSEIFGARPMRNAISDNVKSILADKILRREIERGDKILMKFDGKNFVIEK